MKSVLIDNWTIERIIDNFSNNKKMISEEVKALLIAMVLWDDVCFLDDENSSWWKYIVDNMEEYCFLKQLKPIKNTDDHSLIKETEKSYLELYSKQYTSLVAQRTLEYLNLANEKGLSYLPLGERAKFVRENDLYKHFNIYYDRIDAIEQVDKDALDYFTKLDEKIRKTKLEFHPSCLFDYISKSTDTVTDMFCYVNEFKSQKMVKEFRKWADNLENEIKHGKIIKINQFKEDLEYLEKAYGQVSADVSVGIPVGVGINLSIPFNKIYRPHLTFPLFLYKEKIVNPF